MNTKNNWLLWMLLSCLMLTGLHANAYNRLSIPDVVMRPGHTIELPVNLENDDQVIGVQFTLTLPEGFSIDTESLRSTDRTANHELRVKNMQGNDYLCMIYNIDNTALSGNKGTLCYLTLRATAQTTVGETYTMTMSDAAASDIEMNNVLTETSVGTISINEYPDLEVSNVATDKNHYSPGDPIVVTWTVSNVGDIATLDGWSEHIMLIDGNGSTCFLTTARHQDVLDAGGVVTRRVEATIPQVAGIDGEVTPQVRIAPNSNCGERAEAQANNTATGPAVQLDALLYLSLSKQQVEENNAKPVNAVVTRSGNRQQDMVVTLSCSDSRLSIPETVTIPAGQSSVDFTATVIDNDIVDDGATATVTAAATGMNEATAILTIVDNETPALTLAAAAREITEGESVTLTVSIPRALDRDLTIQVSNDKPERFNYNANAVIPAGSTSATVIAATIDDNTPELDVEVTFVASCEGYDADEAWVTLHDNDLPTMELTLAPTTVSEAAGANAIVAKLRRLDHIDSEITVELSDDGNGDLFYDKKVAMPAGVSEVQFMIGVVDNSVMEGDRTVNVTAAIYIKSCSCSAQGGSAGSVTQAVTITDNDGPALTLTASSATIAEGDAMTLTVTRNNASDQPLTVSLSSDHDSGLQYDNVVTIPAGETSVQVTLTALENSDFGDDAVITLTASAEGYSSATCWIMVADQTLPDAVITSFELSSREVEVGDKLDFIVTIANNGSRALPEQTKTAVYLVDDGPFEYLYTQADLLPGESVTLTRTVTVPDVVGEYQPYAVVNDDKAVKETVVINNTSEREQLTIKPPYVVTEFSTDKEVYQAQETIVFSGQISGKAISNVQVEVYTICDGLRRTVEATTDENGHFVVEHQPFAGETGHFVAGACYPGVNAKQEMAAYDIVGLRRATNDYLICDLTLNETYPLQVQLYNPSQVPLHHVTMNVLSQPGNYGFNPIEISELPGNATMPITVQVTGLALSPEVNEWEQAQVEFISEEGARTVATIYLYCRNAQGQLRASISRINTTMTRGETRTYPFHITNIGKGSTGMITLALPDWMSAATPMTMPALEQGDSAMIVLQFTPTDEMELNVPRTGQIAINCENGAGLALPFSIEPVSTVNGTLIVDVCDEYTYETTEAPHVSGATVIIKHPTTGEIIAQGVTDADGLFPATLHEGLYALRVSADRHESYAGYVMVDAEREKREVINLGLNVVSIDWRVVETTVEDQYTLDGHYTYETNVPVPIVTISTYPQRIEGEQMVAGESQLIYVTMTNEGLIDALNVELELPESNGMWAMRALAMTEPFTLAPHQSVVIPVMFTKLADQPTLGWSLVSDAYKARFHNCLADLAAKYMHKCGEDLKKNKLLYKLAFLYCALASIEQDTYPAGYGPGIWPPLGGGGSWSGGYTPIDDGGRPFSVRMRKCNPILWKCLPAIADALISEIPYIGVANTAANLAIDAKAAEQGEKVNAKTFMQNVSDIIDDANPIFAAASAGSKLLTKSASKVKQYLRAAGFVTALWTCVKAVLPGNDDEYVWYHFGRAADMLDKQADALQKIYGQCVFPGAGSEIEGNVPVPNAPTPDPDPGDDPTPDPGESEFPDKDTWDNSKPDGVTHDQWDYYYDYLYHTYTGDGQDPHIDADALLEYANEYQKYDSIAQDEGYESLADMVNKILEELREKIEGGDESVCSTVSLNISQEMVLTRQAFRGTLTVQNGSEDNAIRDARLTLVVKDEDGNVATAHEFQINLEELQGFDGEQSLDANWTLEPGGTGTATILFIPTKYAAPEYDKVYAFGGSLTYVDPINGLTVTKEILPDYLTVKPSPDLALDYFMQRDIYGDDPLTEEIEPMRDAEFALIIDNQGYGDALNLKMITHQPEITDNEKGLLIDFRFVSSQLNGEEAILAMDDDIATDFGTIEAQSQAYAQWWMQSSLTGHFTKYDVTYNHVTSYGNQDLSLIDTVRVHELIHGFTASDVTGQRLRGFLVNDRPDAHDQPDRIHFTNATQQDVAMSTARMTQISDTQYLLQVTSAAPGWNYGWVPDPTLGKQQVVSVVCQSDGSELYADNVWTTDRVLRDGAEPLYENRLHYVVDISGLSEAYVITFEPRPKVELAVASFEGIPAAGVVLTEALTTATVVFNKPIDASTFTAADITLSCQGNAIDISSMDITPLSTTTFALDLEGFTVPDGFYVLTVQTAGITDLEGFNGASGKQATWLQYTSLIPLTVAALPAQGGAVAPESGEYSYNEMLHLTATPSPGYQFSCWMDGDEIISNEPETDYPLTGTTRLMAKFTPIRCLVEIDSDADAGTVVGAQSSICDYGTELNLTATPAPGYEFDAWMVNGQWYSNDPNLTITIEQDMVIVALFKAATPVPVTPTPVITYEVTDDEVIITATGEGDVQLYIDGQPVDNPYVIKRGDSDQTVTATATAIVQGQTISAEATAQITIPAREDVPPTPGQVEEPTFVEYTMDGVEGCGVLIFPTTEGSAIRYQVYIWNEATHGWDLLTDWTDYTGTQGEIFFTKPGARYRIVAYAYVGDVQSEESTYELTIEIQPTAIDERTMDKTVVSVRYFNTLGQQVQRPDGTTIVVTTYSDGTTSVVKVRM